MFLCHKTEYPDELSLKNKQKKNIPTAKCYMYQWDRIWQLWWDIHNLMFKDVSKIVKIPYFIFTIILFYFLTENNDQNMQWF